MLKNITESVKLQISSHVLNQDIITELALASFFAGGHILLTGPTGIGKTQWAQAFAGALGLRYDYAQITENWSSDGLFGTYTHDIESRELISKPGALFSPVFHAEFYSEETENHLTRTHGFSSSQTWVHMHIIDAIDRQKPSLTDGGSPFPLPETHFIIASCNGQYNLPKTLTDRFMMKLYVNYPGVAAEKQMLQMHHVDAVPETEPTPVCTPEVIIQARHEAQNVAIEDTVFNYIVNVTETTRRVNAIQTGASPRASISLMQAAKAYAAIKGRDYVVIDDVQSLAIPVLRHRITLRPDAIKEGLHADRIIESIIVGKG